ncbi:MAG: hypothetical protein K0Q43_5749 [Ramlibacter sp.]|nr:hypothetical protein [Ramlibacter sp.]
MSDVAASVLATCTPEKVTGPLPNRLESFTRTVSPPSESRTTCRSVWLSNVWAAGAGVPGKDMVASCMAAVQEA